MATGTIKKEIVVIRYKKYDNVAITTRSAGGTYYAALTPPSITGYIPIMVCCSDWSYATNPFSIGMDSNSSKISVKSSVSHTISNLWVNIIYQKI